LSSLYGDDYGTSGLSSLYGDDYGTSGLYSSGSSLSSLYSNDYSSPGYGGNFSKIKKLASENAFLKAKIEELEDAEGKGFLGLPKLGGRQGVDLASGGIGFLLSNMFKEGGFLGGLLGG
jgi:hypothetical protein